MRACFNYEIPSISILTTKNNIFYRDIFSTQRFVTANKIYGLNRLKLLFQQSEKLKSVQSGV